MAGVLPLAEVWGSATSYRDMCALMGVMVILAGMAQQGMPYLVGDGFRDDRLPAGVGLAASLNRSMHATPCVSSTHVRAPQNIMPQP